MTIENIEQEIQKNDAFLLYFSGENCGVCKALFPKLESSFQTYFPKIKQCAIRASDNPALAAHFGVFTIPTVLIFFDGKETKRESRHISVDALIHSTQRTYQLFFTT